MAWLIVATAELGFGDGVIDVSLKDILLELLIVLIRPHLVDREAVAQYFQVRLGGGDLGLGLTW